jgi:hypothetical protein
MKRKVGRSYLEVRGSLQRRGDPGGGALLWDENCRENEAGSPYDVAVPVDPVDRRLRILALWRLRNGLGGTPSSIVNALTPDWESPGSSRRKEGRMAIAILAVRAGKERFVHHYNASVREEFAIRVPKRRCAIISLRHGS